MAKDDQKTDSLLARLYPNDGGVTDVNMIHLRDFALSEAMAADSDMLLEADPTGITDMFAEYTREGLSLESACKLVCIPRRTVAAWLSRAADGLEPYVSFALALSEAEAQLERDLIQQWRYEKGQRSTQALAMLERRFPDKWKPFTPGGGGSGNGPNKGPGPSTVVNVQAISIPSNGREKANPAIDVDYEVSK